MIPPLFYDNKLMGNDLHDWENIDLHDYIDTLDDDTKAIELEKYGKSLSMILLKEHMTKFENFYYFMRDYSPCDYRIINRKPHVSQRVIVQHIDLWNAVHNNKLKRIRIFFL